MRRAELRCESFLAENRGTTVTMAQIKRACGLDWEEAAHVWNRVLPRLADAGLLRGARHHDAGPMRYSPAPALVAGVADLQWSRLAPVPVPVG